MRVNSLHLWRAASGCARPQSYFPSCRIVARWSSSDASVSTPSSPSQPRQWSTSLAKNLAEAIVTTGPISVASYMRQCLTSMDNGYYTKLTDGRDQFGAKGDFVTSPEISQVFGELVGVWMVSEWLRQRQVAPEGSKIHIIEIGPGRGTLMMDMLRAISNFKAMAKEIEHIYLVEASPHLREAQRKLLCGDAEMRETDIGYQSRCKYLPVDITWCEDIRFVPRDPFKAPYVVAHEFFDALPIHIFQNVLQAPSDSTSKSSTIQTPTGPITPRTAPQPQSTGPQFKWHELVVSPIPCSDLAAQSTTKSDDPTPEFQISISKTPTYHAQYLPNTSPRYKALSNTPDAIIEVSPDSLTYAASISTRIGGGGTSPVSRPSRPTRSPSQTPAPPHPLESHKSSPSGCALILDYGPSDTIPTNSLRGIRAHKLVSPFAYPGEVDISADVDFLALAEAAINASPGVEVHGPVEQGVWLGLMGGRERVEGLVRAVESRPRNGKAATEVQKDGGSEQAEETKKRIITGWNRLIDRGPNGMGKLYKVMAIVPHVPGRELGRPVGFGGGVNM